MTAKPVIDLRHPDEDMTINDTVAVIVVRGRIDADCAVFVGGVQVELGKAACLGVDAVELATSMDRDHNTKQGGQDGNAGKRRVRCEVRTDQIGIEECQGQHQTNDADQDANDHHRPMKADAATLLMPIVAHSAVTATQVAADRLRAGEHIKQPGGKAEQDARSFNFAVV